MVAETQEPITTDMLREVWEYLTSDEQAEAFHLLPPTEAVEFYQQLSTRDQVNILRELAPAERRLWLRLLAPDDAADVVQAAPSEIRQQLLQEIDERTRREVTALLAYAEDEAGGLMSPRYARVRPDMTVDEAISYLRCQAPHLETMYYAYVLDAEQRLVGVVSFRMMFVAEGRALVRDVMKTEVVSVHEAADQEEVARLIARHDLNVIPVVDEAGRMKGIVTVDDIVDVVQEEATEDIQKLGGMEALDMPYMQTGFWHMIQKRVGWLALLFLGGTLTATALSHYKNEFEKVVALSLFVPLIIASGGNSGSQATTLVIRAMALGNVRMRDWWKVVRREVLTGLCLGLILATIGFSLIVLARFALGAFEDYYLLIAATVSAALVGVVVWGTCVGSMLPFILRRLGFDPASASAPFVATLVDVFGLVIYFKLAGLILRGTLL